MRGCAKQNCRGAPHAGRRPLCLGRTCIAVTPEIMRGWPGGQGLVWVSPKRIIGQGRWVGELAQPREHPAGMAQTCLVTNRYRRTKKGERERSPSVSPFRLNMLTARYFFACGLNVVRGERTRPVSVEKPQGFPTRGWQSFACKRREPSLVKVGGRNVPPHPSRRGPDQHGRPGPLAPHFRGAYLA